VPGSPTTFTTKSAHRVRYCGASERHLLGELRKWLSRAQSVEDDSQPT
jgi:hypothetical protein